MFDHTRGYPKAAHMPGWAGRKGGRTAAPDGFDRNDALTLASLMDAWFRRLQERAYSPKTVDAHRWALRTFVRWAEERALRAPVDISKPILEAFQRWLFEYRKADGKPLGVTTQRSRLGALQRFFAWLCRENLLGANPAADLELPRKPLRLLPKALSRAEIESLLAIPDVTDPLGLRDRAILETFYGAGIRRAECARLDTDDLDPERGVLAVRGKGGKDRVVPAGAQALHWVQRYLREARPLLETARSARALFLSGYGERISSGYLGNWMRHMLDRARVQRAGSCHLMRHSCATHMLENGADIRFIQQQLGHARLDTTQIYTEVSVVQLREVHARTHPHGRMVPPGETGDAGRSPNNPTMPARGTCVESTAGVSSGA